MLEQVAIIAGAVAWLACIFTVLQLVELRAHGALAGMVGIVVVGALAVATRNHELGVEWLRSAGLRSDALALTVLPAACATSAGTLSTSSVRRSRWGPTTASVAAFACAVTGIAALAIGRSEWYWEFVAVMVAGVLLAVTGAATTFRRGASPNIRVVFACAGVFGVFLFVGGAALLAAWRALA